MNPHIGTSLNDFLEKESLLAETEAIALKLIIAFQLTRAMQEQNLSKADLCGRSHFDGQAPTHGSEGALQRGGLGPVARVEEPACLLLIDPQAPRQLAGADARLAHCQV